MADLVNTATAQSLRAPDKLSRIPLALIIFFTFTLSRIRIIESRKRRRELSLLNNRGIDSKGKRMYSLFHIRVVKSFTLYAPFSIAVSSRSSDFFAIESKVESVRSYAFFSSLSLGMDNDEHSSLLYRSLTCIDSSTSLILLTILPDLSWSGLFIVTSIPRSFSCSGLTCITFTHLLTACSGEDE